MAYTAPGVYIEELPSGVHTIAGVATSRTAFVGRARCGPVNEPTLVFSFDEFERRFGGLWVKSPMSQAVRHFFLNGGSEVLIVRAINGGVAGERAEKASLALPATLGSMTLRATAAARALSGFKRLSLTTQALDDDTFKLTVAALARASNADVVLRSYEVDVDVTGNIAQTLAGADPAPLVELVGDSTLSGAPDDGVTFSTLAGAAHRATLRGYALTLQATDAARALVDFDHLALTVLASGENTFTLSVEAKDAEDETLVDDDDAPFAYTVDLDLTGDVAALLAAAQTTQDDPVTLVALADAAPSVLPEDGSYATAGAEQRVRMPAVGATWQVEATAAAVALPGFDHLALSVQLAGATTFVLRVEAQDRDGLALSAQGSVYAYGVPLSLAGGMAEALAQAATPHAPPLRLVGLLGDPPALLPAAETVETEPDGGNHDALLALTADLELEARDEGAWGNALRASLRGAGTAAGFHLTLQEQGADGRIEAEEVFYNLTLGAGDVRSIARVLESESELARLAGEPPASIPDDTELPLAFTGGDDGSDPRITQDIQGSELDKTGLYALLKADLFNLLCIPLASWSTASPGEQALWQNAAVFCEKRRAVLIVDPPQEWSSFAAAVSGASTFKPRSRNAALYFPRILMPDPLREGRLVDFAPGGAVAGVIARTDAQRGVWKAPAGTEASLLGVGDLHVALTDAQQGVLNQLGIDCLRRFPVFGTVVWGGRTLDGADLLASEWKYLPVRRLALYLEETLYRGSRWAVFEPNDEGLWAQLRLNIGSFMHRLFQQGAFQGSSARQAYFVRCDGDTTTQADIDRGIVNVIVGFAPLKPAEFVIIKIQQLAEQASA